MNRISLKEVSTLLPEVYKNKWRLMIVSFIKYLHCFNGAHFDFAIIFVWQELISSGDH